MAQELATIAVPILVPHGSCVLFDWDAVLICNILAVAARAEPISRRAGRDDRVRGRGDVVRLRSLRFRRMSRSVVGSLIRLVWWEDDAGGVAEEALTLRIAGRALS